VHGGKPCDTLKVSALELLHVNDWLAGKTSDATNRNHAISNLKRVQEMGKPNERWRETVLR
jgi:hypothetical protein